jgi:NAD(P)-dependent dehydrogenase (short-subunit alcohol dehydrogenase family)
MSIPAMGVYGATKYAVEAVSDALRMEVAGMGIGVVVIEPGFVATDIVDASARESAEHGGQHGSARTAGWAQYESLIERTDRFLEKQMRTALPVDKLARAIADVAEARKPRARYVIPLSARTLVAIMTRLPDRMADAAKRRVLGSPA